MLSRLRSQAPSARTFDGSSQYLSVTAAPNTTGEPLTLFAWGRTLSVAATKTLFSLCNSGDVGRYLLGYTLNSYAFCCKGDDVSTSVYGNTSLKPVAGQWHAYCGVFVSNTSRTCYLDGVAGTANTTSCDDPALNTVAIGARRTASVTGYWNGDVAHAAVWNADLTAQEVRALSTYRWCPLLVRPQSLVAYWPLSFGFDGDLIGGLTMTPVAAPTWTAGLRNIVYPSPTWRSAKAAEVAGGFQAAWAAGSNMLIGA